MRSLERQRDLHPSYPGCTRAGWLITSSATLLMDLTEGRGWPAEVDAPGVLGRVKGARPPGAAPRP